MAEERIDIVVSERGSRVVRRNLEDIGGSARGAEGALDLLKRALLVLGSAATLQKLVQLVDTFTNLQNRLRNVTSSTAELAVVTERLFSIANETRTAFESTAEMYGRVALSLKDLGVSQQEVLDFTRSLNQAVTLSGASATEANAAMIQLSQGLASGALRGDELRSVMEQLPAVADVIAKGLGVTRGELRLLGEAGKLTAEDILKSFALAREELDEKFKKTVPTIGQAFTVIQNNIMKYIGGLDQATGASSTFARVLLGIADNVDVLAKALGVLATVLGVVFAQRAIGMAIAGLRLLNIAIATNPLGALLLAVTATIAALFAFGDQIMLTEGSVVNMRDVLLAAWDEIKRGLSALVAWFQENFSFIADAAQETFGGMQLDMQTILRFAAKVLDTYIGLWVGAYRAIIAAWEKLPEAIAELWASAMNKAKEVVADGTNALIDYLNKIPGVNIEKIILEPTANDNLGATEALGAAMGEAFMSGLTVTLSRDALERVFTLAEERARQRILQQQADAQAKLDAEGTLGNKGVNKVGLPNASKVNEHIEELRREGEALKVMGDERAVLLEKLKLEKEIKRSLSVDEAARLEAQVRANAELQRMSELMDEIKGPQLEYQNKLQALNQLLDENKISTEEAAKAQDKLRLALLETKTDMASGFERGLIKLKSQYDDFATGAETAVVNAFGSMEDAFAELATTGKMSFQSLANAIIGDLARIAARAIILRPLLGMLGSTFGMHFADGGPVKAASGGMIRGPGGPRGDRVPALLSDGEFVMNAESTNHFRPLLEMMNSMQHFADGGFVSQAAGIASPIARALAPSGQQGQQVFAPHVEIHMDGSSGDPAADARQAEMAAKAARAQLEQMFGEFLARQGRPGGMLNPQEAF